MTTPGIIGVICKPAQRPWVREFFELFKTPWEFYRPDAGYSVILSTETVPEVRACRLVIIYSADADQVVSNGETLFIEYEETRLPLYGRAGGFSNCTTPLAHVSGGKLAVVHRVNESRVTVIHAGYDLFSEVELLLTTGQPVENAGIPALDIHISMLRDWILSAGIPLLEVPPAPAGHEFIACLTHDVDFVRITDHKLDHTLLGFARRASAGSMSRFAKGDLSLRDLVQNINALASLPAVYLGLCDDFWFEDFDRYLALERDTKATFFFIPFKNRAGEKVDQPHSRRRAAAYDVADEKLLIEKLSNAGNEISVHGIDAWHDTEKGIEERRRIVELSGNCTPGVRMHWLCFDDSTPRVLDEAGFIYDSTVGYNDAAGYRAGTLQVFSPRGATTLLELPLHIQDAALFSPGRLSPNDSRAWSVCESILKDASRYGGALTILWHTRSMAPERLWGSFYIRLLEELKSRHVWFATAAQAVEWFRSRRAVSFERGDSGARVRPGSNKQTDIVIRFHFSTRAFRDIPLGDSREFIATAIGGS